TGWGYTVVPTAVTSLPVGEAISVTFVITGGSPGYVDTSDLTAVSAADPALSHTVTAVTRIEQTAGVLLEPSQSDSGLPDQTLVYTHQLTNTGDGPDSFGLSVTAQLPEPWAVTLVPTQTGSLLPGQSIPVTVTVQVPADALSGTVHQAVVTAVSAYDPTVTDTVTDTTTVLPTYGLLIEPAAAERVVPPGALATYTHTVRHLGNYSDTITIDTAGFGPAWVVSPTRVTLDLPPFGTDILAVSLDVPTGTTGLTHTMFITATSGVSTAVQATAVNTTTVQTVLGVILQPDRALSVLAGQTAVYSHTLTNSGNVADSFALASNSSQGWVVTVVPTATGMLAPNQTMPVTVTVAVPAGTAVGTIDTALITATSQLDTAVTDTVTDTTTVIDDVVGAGVILQPDRASLILPGQTAVYNHTLTNVGDSTDSFDLTFTSSEGWQVNITPNSSGPLAPNETLNVTVAVISPPNVTVGTVDTTVITATSSNDTAVSDTATDTTRIIGQTGGADVDISPNNSASSLPDQTVFYYHMVRNDGDANDTFDLSAVSSEGWPVSLSHTSVSLAPNGQQQIEVQVTVPATATVGTVDVTTVTARSTADSNVSDTATNTTTVTDNVVVDLSLEPDNAADGTPGQAVLYNHTLTNLGNQTDTFSLATISSNGWVVAVSPLTVSLEAGQQAVVTVTVDVPTTAVAGTTDNTTVVAISGNDSRVQDTALNTTTI
ncbi:MAG: hypothetical protein KDD89_10350, partial [Anaerolineales bacterium]|nr:hypothetical protein [Anaerolineales bacterium]